MKKKKEKKKQWMNDMDDEDIFAEEDVKETNVADSDKDLSALEFLFFHWELRSRPDACF